MTNDTFKDYPHGRHRVRAEQMLQSYLASHAHADARAVADAFRRWLSCQLAVDEAARNVNALRAQADAMERAAREIAKEETANTDKALIAAAGEGRN